MSEQLALDDVTPAAAASYTGTFVDTDELRTIRMWNRDPAAPPRYEYDLRGTPIGRQAQVWQFERMVTSAGRSRRVRQRVKVMHCPEGWYGRSGTRTSAPPETCTTFWDWLNRPPGGRDGYRAFHDEHPVVWSVEITQPGADKVLRYCDPELPAEYRPQADGSPPPEFGPLAGHEPARKRERRDEPKDPSRYAIPDPLDTAKVSYWYRNSRGTLAPWPPQRNTWGRLYYKDMPDGKSQSPANRAYADAHWARVKTARAVAIAEIEANPELAAARFARYHSSCCFCGRALSDPRSVTYGIGPECRSYAEPEFLSRMLEKTKRAFAERELRHDQLADHNPRSNP